MYWRILNWNVVGLLHNVMLGQHWLDLCIIQDDITKWQYTVVPFQGSRSWGLTPRILDNAQLFSLHFYHCYLWTLPPHCQGKRRTPLALCVMAGWLAIHCYFICCSLWGSCMVLLTLISVCPTWYRIYIQHVSATMLKWSHLHEAYFACSYDGMHINLFLWLSFPQSL